ncbi:MAG: universal stress protein [Polyangiaceae bacterium]
MNTPSERAFVIVAAVDDTETSAEVIKEAALIAHARSADLHIVHAYQSYMPKGVYDEEQVTKIQADNQAQREAHMAKLSAIAGQICNAQRVWGHIVRGEPAATILGVASAVRSDLIVVGTHDYRGLTRFLLGSISEVVSRKAHCPVMLLRPVSYPPSTVPTIEPPCSDCVRVRNETKNPAAWCERHSHGHSRAILHYEYPASYGVGAQTFRP